MQSLLSSTSESCFSLVAIILYFTTRFQSIVRLHCRDLSYDQCYTAADLDLFHNPRSTFGHTLGATTKFVTHLFSRTSLILLSSHDVNPLMGALKPQSNSVIGTLAVDGRSVTFGTARIGLGGLLIRPVRSSLYQT